MKRNDGVTLIELLVSMAISVVVIGAAMTVLLLCARTQSRTFGIMSDRNDASIFMNFIKNTVNDSDIVSLLEEYDKIYDKDEGKVSINGNTLLKDVSDYSVKTESGDKLIKASIKIGDETYETSVRRTEGIEVSVNNVFAEQITIDEAKEKGKTNEIKLVLTALSQYKSRGTIRSNNEKENGVRYSDWYSENKWPSDTAWCGCFVSWCLKQVKEDAYQFASCPRALKAFTNLNEKNIYGEWCWFDKSKASVEEASFEPQTGDIVLFNWSKSAATVREETEKGTYTADHVGIVVWYEEKDGEKILYTIEGNSTNMVRLRQYNCSKTNSPIIGFERLDLS